MFWGVGGYTPRAGNKRRGGDAWGWGAEERTLWGVTFGIKMTTRNQFPSEETPSTKGRRMAGKGKAVQTRPTGRKGAESAGPRKPREGVGTILSARRKGTL